MSTPQSTSWIEIGAGALAHNIRTFRGLVGSERELSVVVKSNAYGHGLLEVARIAYEAGADWLDVFNIDEAFALRDAGVALPILVFGPTPAAALPRAAREGVRVTAADPTAAAAMTTAGADGLLVHVKLETGTHRQGFLPERFDAVEALAAAPGLTVEGAYTHFADIEDTTDHSFAMRQLDTFAAAVQQLEDRGVRPSMLHTACTAAALLFPSTFFDLVRVGIGTYGLWPSKETFVSVKQEGREPVDLRPAMTWKTRLSEIKQVPAGVTVGYGRTFKTTRATRLAVLPVGYANGYDRHLSNQAHVLIRGARAKVCGRVMMNMIVVDVTDIDGAAVGDEAVLLGAQGDERVSAETIAGWLDTINYEVVTRADPWAPRVVVAAER
jgi:alanine racemase